MESNRQKDLRRKQLGRRGEDIAVEMLQLRGMRVIARNVHAGEGEIDIIALQSVECAQKRLAFVRFVEVKSRREPVEGDPLEAVNALKQRKIVSAAKAWLASGRCSGILREAGFFEVEEFHFDVITLVWSGDGENCKTEYIEDAFYPIYT